MSWADSFECIVDRWEDHALDEACKALGRLAALAADRGADEVAAEAARLRREAEALRPKLHRIEP